MSENPVPRVAKIGATQETLAALLTAAAQGEDLVGLDSTTLAALEQITVLGPLTDAQLRAAAVLVSGPLTDEQLRAAEVPVSGPLTDAELRASQVPVSGPLTDAQLRAQYVAVTSPLGADFMAGRVRSAGGKLSVSAGGTGFFCLSNPSNSAKVITLNDFTLATSVTSDVQFRFDTVLASASTLAAFSPNRAVAGTTAAVAQTSAAAPSTAGTTLSPIYRLSANETLIRQFPVVILPGQSVACSVQAALANDFYVSASWVEV